MILHPTYDVNAAGHLTAAGLDTVELAREFGTPAYLIDTDAVRAMCRLYKSAFADFFGPDSTPAFAGKSLCYKGLYRLIAEEGLAADCVSPGELVTANAAGFPMEKVFFHGNNKTDADLALACSPLILDGFHCHVGSQIFDIEPFRDACDIMLAFIARIRQSLSFEAKILNIGGGFGVRYTERDPEIDYRENVRLLGAEIDRMCALHGVKKPAILMEPGRSIVAAAGCTLYTVGTVKTIPGFRSYVSVDGGMPDNPRYALYQSVYEIFKADDPLGEKTACVTLGGRCCDSGDLIGENMPIQPVKRGDIIAVAVTGAYNYSMASNYNRIPRPPVVMVSGGKTYEAVRRESCDDLIRLDV